MIDVHTESLVNLAEAAKLFPSRGKHVHVGTVRTWAEKGVKGGVVLETVRVGGARYTSREAIERFVLRLNPQPEREPLSKAEAKRRKEAVDRLKAVLNT